MCVFFNFLGLCLCRQLKSRRSVAATPRRPLSAFQHFSISVFPLVGRPQRLSAFWQVGSSVTLVAADVSPLKLIRRLRRTVRSWSSFISGFQRFSVSAFPPGGRPQGLSAFRFPLL